MKITPHRKPQNAFTMVEIAISIAVIGFALVAIIGVLPTGLGVQKDNREDTIINQDGPYLLEAIRSGARGLDHLTNYVGDPFANYSNAVGVVLTDTNIPQTITTNYDVFNDAPFASTLIGLLSLPKGAQFIKTPIELYVVRVEARLRALSGSALEQNGSNSTVAFSYLATSEVVRFRTFATDSTNYVPLTLPPRSDGTNCAPGDIECLTRFDRYREAVGPLATNLFEARLKFSWPVLPNGKIGPNRQVFRTMVSGTLMATNTPSGGPLVFFQPQKYY